MKIKSLSISNFKSIKRLKIENLPDMVVIAGPNGCGKSTIFDAIRLLKSVYGGYQPNEINQWFSEFQINLDRRFFDWSILFQDKSQPLEITMDMVITDGESDFIINNLETLVKSHVWSQYTTDPIMNFGMDTQAIASRIRQYGPEVEKITDEETKRIQSDLELCKTQTAYMKVDLRDSNTLSVKQSPILEILFSNFKPKEIGIIEYHGPQRNYQREQVGGINLNIETVEQQGSQHALYNYTNKY